ncbi:response regulator [Leptolyngbya sp. FACHB-541]|uniref:ATP-binding protein n=1 Tax=Leptolyngbya sp. FACHB-541 TaxID=2692810 RepID=UPI001681DB80|nr:ATP-binding protein [Leptolyngbya sp. FACHB-541]MBD2000040.1 response regulator [Leptolyngbya sp. FACHB-541]
MHSWFRHPCLSSLRFRLILLVLLAVIPALGLILHTANTQRQSAARNAQESLLRLTKSTAASQRQAIEGARQLLIALSQVPAIHELDTEACNQLLANLLKQYRSYAGFVVADAAGNLTCSAPATTQSISVADRAYFRLALANRDFAIGEYQVERITGKSTLNFGYPILDESGKVRAIVSAALDLDWMDRLAAEAELPEGSTVTVTDRNGTILVRYPDSQDWVGKSVPNAPITQRILAQREGTTEATSLDGVEQLYAFTTLGNGSHGSFDQDVHIRIGVPRNVAFAEANQLLVENLVGLGCVTVLALTAAWFGGDIFLTRKVQSLVQTAQQLKSGDLSARTELADDTGELGHLARAFDEMAAAIAAREQAIASLNQDLQTLFEVIPIGVLITQDPEFRQVKANPAFTKMLGSIPDANVSYTPADAPPPSYKIIQEGRELTPNEFPLRYAALHNVEIKGTEVDIVRADGSRFSLFGYAKPLLDEQGQVRGSVAAFLDISDRKQAEAEREQLLHQLETSVGQLEAILNNMTEGLVIADPQGNMLTFNPAALALHEYDTVEQVRRHLQELPDTFEVHDLQGNFVSVEQWPIARALNGETFSNYEIQVRRRDTDKTWIGSYSGTPVQDKQGKVILAIVTIRDVTKQHQAQLELARSLTAEQTARANAEAANRIKDEFLAILSHELRTPLNPILGWSKLLRSRSFDAATTDRALETIERNAKLQTQLIEDLLDVSRILQGKLRLDNIPVDLATTIQAAIETVQLAATTKSINLQAVLDPTVGKVSGDPGRLQQVIWNLLSNAVKFTPPGGQVEVRLSLVKGHGSWVKGQQFKTDPQGQRTNYAQITVIDTGKGITPDFLPHVFDAFRQADGATTRQFGGLGLGLAIARHLVELHGGTITVASPGEEQGSTFTVRLPLLKDEEAGIKDATDPLHPSSFIPHPLKSLRVLLVDDDTDTRTFFAFVLEQAGAEVIAVASAEAALHTLTHTKQDLLLSDIGMPDMDGYALLKQVRSLPPEQGGNIPAIALTAYAGELNQQQALTAGFQQHLAKPVEPEELIKAIAALKIGERTFNQES